MRTPVLDAVREATIERLQAQPGLIVRVRAHHDGVAANHMATVIAGTDNRYVWRVKLHDSGDEFDCSVDGILLP